MWWRRRRILGLSSVKVLWTKGPKSSQLKILRRMGGLVCSLNLFIGSCNYFLAQLGGVHELWRWKAVIVVGRKFGNKII